MIGHKGQILCDLSQTPYDFVSSHIQLLVNESMSPDGCEVALFVLLFWLPVCVNLGNNYSFYTSKGRSFSSKKSYLQFRSMHFEFKLWWASCVYMKSLFSMSGQVHITPSLILWNSSKEFHDTPLIPVLRNLIASFSLKTDIYHHYKKFSFNSWKAFPKAALVKTDPWAFHNYCPFLSLLDATDMWQHIYKSIHISSLLFPFLLKILQKFNPILFSVFPNGIY